MQSAVKCADHVFRSRFLNDVKIILSFRYRYIHSIVLKGPAAGASVSSSGVLLSAVVFFR